MAKTLYICYFGLLEPLVQTQVIPYLVEIGKAGVGVTLLTFEPDFTEKWTAEQIEEERAGLAAKGIAWHCLPYHKRPSAPATAYDILRGTLFVRRLMAEERFDVLHCRVHVPAVMGALARKLSRRQRPKLLFDIRGFFPEEYVDAGIWREDGLIYRAVKRVERWLMRESDGFVVLTEKARDILFPESRGTGFDKLGRPVEVIPCCVNFEKFGSINGSTRSEIRRQLGVGNRNVISYVGSFGGWYLSEEMLDFFAAAHRHDARNFFLILTQRHTEEVVEGLKLRGIGERDFHVTSALPVDVAKILSAAGVAVSFIKPTYSKQASSPTKIAEYLACGLPIIANSGVGDVDALIAGEGVGVLLDDFRDESYKKALNGIRRLGDIGDRCRRASRQGFDLEWVGGERYRRIYRDLLRRSPD